MDWPAALREQGRAVLVTVASAEGSVPREAGAWMLVLREHEFGTIGGGRLEYDALQAARDLLLAADPRPFTRRYPLGPSLGQCCGGVVQLAFEPVGVADAAALGERLAQGGTPVALFGGGHVGRAIARLAEGLPVRLAWIDSRDGIFPAAVPANVACEHSDPVHRAVSGLEAGSLVLVMSFSHAEDLDIVAACLQRQRERADLPFIGLIGSKTKWATFRRRLEQRGFTAQELAAVHCPIGIEGIRGKQPGVIAVAAMAQLLRAAGA